VAVIFRAKISVAAKLCQTAATSDTKVNAISSTSIAWAPFSIDSVFGNYAVHQGCFQLLAVYRLDAMQCHGTKLWGKDGNRADLPGSAGKNTCCFGENQNEAAGMFKNYSFLVDIPQANTYDFATF
jgi:hypothetical protein